MNANNQQTSFKTHRVNTKTIADVIEHLDEVKNMTNVLWQDAKGHDELRKELYEAFHHMTEAILAMKAARILNKIDSKEE
ncbi:MAG: hypothetical protein IJG07_03940 [Prevotella sp.]|nr:hypothetical protein [Prevotella sp.]